MTEITAIPQTRVSPDVAAGVTQFLSPVVINLIALAVDGKQAHWHVRGPNFQAVHELFDSVVAHAQDGADLAAERIVALGLPLDARIQTVASKTTTAKLAAGFRRSEAVIAEIIAHIDATLELVQSAIQELEELDPAAQDIVIGIEQTLVKDRWFLFAHVSE